MKVVQINVFSNKGSTGRICAAIAKRLDSINIDNYILYSSGKGVRENDIKFCSELYRKIQGLWSYLFGIEGFTSFFSTRTLVRHLKKIGPDTIIIHNIHSHDVNLRVLFRYLKRNPSIRIFWVFHDCWAFTGYCPHFSISKCDKWRSQCLHCENYREYSWIWDRSRYLFNKKKSLLDSLNLSIVTPSIWLKSVVKESFLNRYPINVINNGIDLTIFKPTFSDFRLKHCIGKDKKIVLGVAFDWSYKKGLDVFVELSRRLPFDTYQIVIVGTNAKIDSELPKDIISIHKTMNVLELAEIYSCADVFVNPTREDTFPTVNMEALACATPVITFNTGGSPESIDKRFGCVVDCDDIDAMEKAIVRITHNDAFLPEECVRYARRFDEQICYDEYIALLKK